MSRKERVRLRLLGRVARHEISIIRAAGLTGASVRRTRRSWKRHRTDGDAGLAHRARGKRPDDRLDELTRAATIELCRSRNGGFWSAHPCEKLEQHGQTFSPDRLTNLLKGSRPVSALASPREAPLTPAGRFVGPSRRSPLPAGARASPVTTGASSGTAATSGSAPRTRRSFFPASRPWP